MHLSRQTRRDYLIGFAFVLLMVASATWLNDYEIILPEIGALTAGLWIYHDQNWLAHPLKIFLAPSGTAVLGFIVNQFNWAYPVKVLVTVALMLGLLKGLRSTLAPAFATGLLPIIVDATHWSFIVAIFIFTFLLMAVVLGRQLHVDLPETRPLFTHTWLIFSLAVAGWSLLVWALGKPEMAAIPPVLVVFFEVLQQPKYGKNMAIKHVLALSGAATIGVGIHIWFASWLLTTLIALPLVFVWLQILHVKLPAAYAFPLLALVLPTTMFAKLPLTALLAAIFFLGIAYSYHYFKPTQKSVDQL
ncbi:hypothetical protein [Lactiplantibacillus fabifermentans]|uniref:Uncharacterized protein n=2 Tax=Lactiplantibacillus fabifermentans TaxID=483011 RepID=A0A0R2NJF4_9LACO|nr:hypothetical protein [Lactiplantibacillus fabifermentans]ETY72750.1 membrane protein [Lactiplantibacillus fabifermentans T30PCM01]KRO24731.1 hypothetical protein DY78_GL001581 [Lactiplantibacillus fabifermentans DSM 21115]